MMMGLPSSISWIARNICIAEGAVKMSPWVRASNPPGRMKTPGGPSCPEPPPSVSLTSPFGFLYLSERTVIRELGRTREYLSASGEAIRRLPISASSTSVSRSLYSFFKYIFLQPLLAISILLVPNYTKFTIFQGNVEENYRQFCRIANEIAKKGINLSNKKYNLSIHKQTTPDNFQEQR